MPPKEKKEIISSSIQDENVLSIHGRFIFPLSKFLYLSSNFVHNHNIWCVLKMMRRRRRKGKRRVIGDGSSRITNFIGTSDSFPTNLVDYSCHLRVVRLMLCVSHYCGYVGMLSAFSTDCTSYTTFNIPHLQTRTFFLHNTYYIISSVCIACR